MAYEPKTWECGEVVTADALNNLEEGVQEALECCGGGTEPLIVREDHTEDCSEGMTGAGEVIMNATWQQVVDTITAGQSVLLDAGGGTYYNLVAVDGAEPYGVDFINAASIPAVGIEKSFFRLTASSKDEALRLSLCSFNQGGGESDDKIGN